MKVVRRTNLTPSEVAEQENINATVVELDTKLTEQNNVIAEQDELLALLLLDKES